MQARKADAVYEVKYQQFGVRGTHFLFRFDEFYYFHSDGYFGVTQLVMIFHVFRDVDFVHLCVTPAC